MNSLNGNERVQLRAKLGLFALIATSLLVAAGTASAQEAHFDILLYDDGAGNLRAGAIDVDDLAPELNTFAIEGELFGDTTSPGSNFTGADPGFYSLSDANAGLLGGLNDNLLGSSAVTLDFLVEPTLNISLAYWDDGLGQFGATPSGESMTLAAGAITGQIGGTNEVLGLPIGTTGTSGFFDDHPDYGLFGGATPGVYLAYAQANLAGLAGPSNPFWLVFGTLDECEETASCTAAQDLFNVGIEEQIEAGISYVNMTLVPEPSTALLFGLGLMGLGRSGRSRR